MKMHLTKGAVAWPNSLLIREVHLGDIDLAILKKLCEVKLKIP